jgi:hypothetical protein
VKVDSKGVARAFKELPRKQRAYIFKAIRKSVTEGVRLAKTMAPKDTGELAQGIHAKYQLESNALIGSVEAAAPDAESQIKALSVEFGRQYKRGRRQPARTGNKYTGKTSPNPFIQRTQSIMGPKHKARVKRAINKAAKEVGLS